MSTNDRVRELAEALLNNPWVDPALRQVVRALTRKWAQEPLAPAPVRAAWPTPGLNELDWLMTANGRPVCDPKFLRALGRPEDGWLEYHLVFRVSSVGVSVDAGYLTKTDGEIIWSLPRPPPR